MPFAPRFTITPQVARDLIRIEGARQAILHLPITPTVLATLRETARLLTTHYSTMIEGNCLTQEQVVNARSTPRVTMPSTGVAVDGGFAMATLLPSFGDGGRYPNNKLRP